MAPLSKTYPVIAACYLAMASPVSANDKPITAAKQQPGLEQIITDRTPCIDFDIRDKNKEKGQFTQYNGLAKHFHPRVIIKKYDDKLKTFTNVQIPPNIGIERSDNGSCYREIHTHYGDNRLHVESVEAGKTHYLTDFINLWKYENPAVGDLFSSSKNNISIEVYTPSPDTSKSGMVEQGHTPLHIPLKDGQVIFVTIMPNDKR